MPGLETAFGIFPNSYDLLRHFPSSNESNDREPFDYQHVFTEAVLKAIDEKMVSAFQPTQSRIPFPFSPMSSMQYPVGNYGYAADLQIFGFIGYVCEKCLTP